jgi:ABC-type microcin C transport system permease subunit YejB
MELTTKQKRDFPVLYVALMVAAFMGVIAIGADVVYSLVNLGHGMHAGFRLLYGVLAGH